jgi:prepilin-type N-terminal cleavage/methylation domain-containing protein
MKQTFKRNLQKGFTLVELLIVVIILAILAAIVVPQFSSSTTDANNSAVQSNLATMRSAIELYAAQHGGTFPGAISSADGSTAAAVGNNTAVASSSFLAQMTLFSDSTGKTYATKPASPVTYGPYLRGATLPADPTNASKTDMTTINAGAVPIAPATVTTATTAYVYDTKTGQIVSQKNSAF